MPEALGFLGPLEEIASSLCRQPRRGAARPGRPWRSRTESLLARSLMWPGSYVAFPLSPEGGLLPV